MAVTQDEQSQCRVCTRNASLKAVHSCPYQSQDGPKTFFFIAKIVVVVLFFLYLLGVDTRGM